MHNPYQTQTAKIIAIKEESVNIKLFRLELKKSFFNRQKFVFQPGQIMMLSLPGFGEAPFAPCNAVGEKYLELSVRKIGRLTEKLHSLKIGDKAGIRGPYGNGWPSIVSQSKKNLLIVVGGLGLIPLRSLISSRDKFLDKDAKIQIFYGAKTPDDFLFKNDLENWRKSGLDVQLTIDKSCLGWDDCVGVVTALFNRVPLAENSLAFLCGPPIMYKFVLEKLKEKKISDEDIFLSLERRMHCGLGVCQHCAVGSHYACKDGPVFQYDKIKNIPGAI